MASFDLIVSGGRCVLPWGDLKELDVGVSGGRIVELGSLGQASAAQRFDARGLVVFPGVIDSQVHFREPGMAHKEDLESGTRAAALGGVTTIFEMPNTKPSTTTAEALADKLDRARGRAWVDHAFFMGAATENAEQLAELEWLPGCAGVKIFMGSSTGSLLVEDDSTLLRVLKSGRRRVAVHCEDEARLRERRHLVDEAPGDPALHPVWRDVETALRATQRLLKLARQAGRRVHVLHVTTAAEMALLAQNKDLASVEVTPQHLTLSAPECYQRLGTRAQMNPPIREAEHQAALWKAVATGVVDVVGSDHAPHTQEEKARSYPASPSGMPGVQTILPVLLDHAAHGRLSLARVADLLAMGPARVYGLARKGRLAVGCDADLTIVDPSLKHEVRDEDQASRVGWSPYAGQVLTGGPVGSFVRGRQVLRGREIIGDPAGQPVSFGDG